jgi:hypothetical protein
VSGRVVLVEKTIVFLPLVWTLSPNAVPQPLQNLTVKLAIDGLTRGYEFLVDNALDVGKKRSTWTGHCCEIDTLFLSSVNLATSTAMTAAESQGHNHTPMFRHWL